MYANSSNDIVRMAQRKETSTYTKLRAADDVAVNRNVCLMWTRLCYLSARNLGVNVKAFLFRRLFFLFFRPEKYAIHAKHFICFEYGEKNILKLHENILSYIRLKDLLLCDAFFRFICSDTSRTTTAKYCYLSSTHANIHIQFYWRNKNEEKVYSHIAFQCARIDFENVECTFLWLCNVIRLAETCKVTATTAFRCMLPIKKWICVNNKKEKGKKLSDLPLVSLFFPFIFNFEIASILCVRNINFNFIAYRYWPVRLSVIFFLFLSLSAYDGE